MVLHKKISIGFIFFFVFIISSSLNAAKKEKFWVEILMERVETPLVDPNFINLTLFRLSKHNRTSGYRLNFNMTVHKPLDDKFSVEIRAPQLYTNVYRSGIINAVLNFCDFLDHFVFAVVLKYSNFPSKCPVIGDFIVKDLTLDYNFRPFYNFQEPISYFKLEVNIFLRKPKTYVMKITAYLKMTTKLGNGGQNLEYVKGFTPRPKKKAPQDINNSSGSSSINEK